MISSKANHQAFTTFLIDKNFLVSIFLVLLNTYNDSELNF